MVKVFKGGSVLEDLEKQWAPAHQYELGGSEAPQFAVTVIGVGTSTHWHIHMCASEMRI